MEKRGASLGQGYGVALWACFAFAWPCLAFPAVLPDPSPAKKDAPADDQPDEVVEFLGSKSGESKSENKEGDAADPEKKGMFSAMRFAPIYIRLGGGVGYSVVRQQSSGSQAVTQEVLSTNLEAYAMSYIWQPWFAKVQGALRYINNVTASSQGGAGGNLPNSSVSGDAALKVFPYSRFPFEASITQNETFTGYGTGAPNAQTNILRLSQRYTPLSYKENYVATLTRTLSGNLSLSKEREDRLDFTANTRRFDKQSHSLTGASYRRKGFGGVVSLVNRLVSIHNYRPDSTFSMNGLANVNYLTVNSPLVATNATSVQLSTFGSWMPKEQPYYLTAAVRGFGANSKSSGASARNRSFNANLGGAYTVNQYLRLDASANVGLVSENGVQKQTGSLGSNQTASINYPFPSINFGDLHYRRNVSANFVNRTSTAGRHAVQTVSVSPSHSLGRNLNWMGGALGLDVSQGVGITKVSRLPGTLSLTHQGRVGWNHAEGTQVSTISLGASDQRTLVGNKTFFQLINLQAVLNTDLDRNSSWNGNLTMQTARNGGEQLTSPFTSSSSASLGYVNRRMFNINRMNFRSDLRMTSESLLPVLASPKDKGKFAWTNKFTYELGRLQLSMQADVGHEQNQTTTTILFSAFRAFGS